MASNTGVFVGTHGRYVFGTYLADSCVPATYHRQGSQNGRESISMARLDRWQGSGTQFVSSDHRGWRENTVVKTDMSGFGRKAGKTLAERDPPNSADNQIPPHRPMGQREKDKNSGNATGTRLGPVRDRNPPMTAQLDARSQENGTRYALFAVDSCRIWAVSAIGGCSGRPGRWP